MTMERDLILLVQAVQLGLSDPETAASAHRAHDRGDAPSLRAALLERVALADADLASLDLAVERLLRRHEGDSRRALAEPGFRAALEAMGLDRPQVATRTIRDDTVTPEAPGRYEPLRGDGLEGLSGSGIGQVRLCHDAHMGRTVARRELPPEDLSDAKGGRSNQATRLLREARVMGRIEHPAVLPVYELGQGEDGRLYFTTRPFRGRSLSSAIKECKTLFDRFQLLPHMVDLCQGLACAHEHGVIHRDLRPSQVLIGELGETVLVDFDRAKVHGQRDPWTEDLAAEIKTLTNAEAGLPTEGVEHLNPAYMSPEMARGELDRLDERSDIWALGALLYEVLTGKPPFVGETPWEVLGKIKEEPPIPPHRTQDDLPKELSEICMRALARRPEDRFASAADMARAIEQVSLGGHATTNDPSFPVRFWRSTTLFSLFLVALAVAGILWLSHDAERISVAHRQEVTDHRRTQKAREQAQSARHREEEARRKAERSTRQAHRSLAEAYLAEAWRALREHRHATARIFAAAALWHDPAHPQGPYRDRESIQGPTPADRRILTGAHSVLQRAEEMTPLSHHATLFQGYRVWRIAISRDGGYLAWCGEDAFVSLYSLSDQKIVARVEMPAAPVMAVAFSHDGKRFAAAGAGGAVRLWSVPDGALVATLKSHTKLGLALAFSPNGKHLATGGTDQQVRVWDLETFVVAHSFTHPNLAIWALEYSQNGRLLASAGFTDGDQSRVRVWDSEDRRSIATFSDHLGPVWTLAFSPLGDTLASGGLDRQIRIYDVKRAALRQRLAGHEGDVTALAFSPDGKHLASASADHSLRLWDTSRWQTKTVLEAHQGHIWGLAFSPDGRRLATGSWDRRVKLWRVHLDREPPLLPAPAPVVWAAYLLPPPADSAQGSDMSGEEMGDVLAIGQDQHLTVWSRRTRKLRYRLKLPSLTPYTVAISAKGRTLAYALENRSIWVLDLQRGRRRVILSGKWPLVTALAFLPQTEALAATGEDGMIRILDLKTRQERYSLKGTPGIRKALAVSPDGSRLAASVSDSQGQRVELWDLKARTLLATLTGHEDALSSLAFTPDSRVLVSGSQDQTLRLWDAASGRHQKVLVGHGDEVFQIAISQDGRWLVSTARDATARVWRLPAGDLHQVLELDQMVFRVPPSPRGEEIAVPNADGVRLTSLGTPAWERDPQPLLQNAERAADLRLDGMTLMPPSEGSTPR